MNIKKKFQTVLDILKKKIPKKFSKTLLFLYLFFLFLGIILTLLYSWFHNLVYCTTIFGDDLCTPIGLFLILAASLPGYLIVGNILAFFPQIPWGISLIFVVLVSGLFYYLIGLFIDKQRPKKLTLPSVNRIVIYASFVLLILFLLMLVNGLRQQ